MTATTNNGVQDWVQKIHFENRVDVDLQVPTKNESLKIQVDEIPNSNTSKDNYLQSILSSKSSTTNTSTNQCTGEPDSCTCYKCQRLRRRAGHRMENGSSVPQKEQSAPTIRKTDSFDTPSKAPDIPQRTLNHRSSTIRKAPSLTAYEKQIPKPVYLQQESIYRTKKLVKNETEKSKRPTSIMDTADNYEISWKEDETGDDLLTSLVTFQTIFDTTDKNDGLSDLLEKKAKELKDQRFKVKEKPKEVLPPRLSECLTISYRRGKPHNPLTLYHTMKMNTGQERTHAYGK